MLSNVEVILLSVVNERPSYAYEINKEIDFRDMRGWVRIGVTSIYQALKKLEEKGLVYSQTEMGDRMPDRKRYYITDSGKAALIETSKRLLSNPEWYYLDLNVGLAASALLPPWEITNCLKERLAGVKSNMKRMKEIYSFGNKIVFKKRAVIKNLIYFREAEENFLQEVIRELSMHEEWQDVFPYIDVVLSMNNSETVWCYC